MKLRIITLLIVCLMISSGLLIVSHSSTNPQLNSAFSQTTLYLNSDNVSLWMRRNGSDPGFPYGGANVAPSVGMDYFGTDTLQITWSYNLSNRLDFSLFPNQGQHYIQIDNPYPYGVTNAVDVADQAKTDSRIGGAWIDDFRVGWESPANMSAVYNAIHHEDANLSHPLTLGLVVYSRNYYVQSPYSWASIAAYFDVIHFWFYPSLYPILYPQFAGYEDAFKELRSWLPTKEYWLGIYLHWYNVGMYPYDFTYEQMSIASRLIKEGYATKLSILENFWIQHNTPTAVLIRDFINQELKMNYTSIWNLNNQLVWSYLGGSPTISLITDPSAKWTNNYSFTSSHLQTVTARNATGSYYVLQNLRNGAHYNVTKTGTNLTFVVEPRQSYKLCSQHWTYYAISSRTYLNSPTSWDYRYVRLSNILNINTTLWVNNSVISISDHIHKNSMANATTPDYGIILNLSASAKLYIRNSTIEPKLRAFPYYFNTTWSNTQAQSRVISIFNSTIACVAGTFMPLGYTRIYDSLFFQAQPTGTNYFSTIWFNGGGSSNEFRFVRNTVWNYYNSNAVDFSGGSVGVFLLPASLYDQGVFTFKSSQIIGAGIGLWVDMSYSDNTTLENTSICSAVQFPFVSTDDYLQCRYENGGPTKLLTITRNFANGLTTGSSISTNRTVYLNVINYQPETQGPFMRWTVNLAHPSDSMSYIISGLRSDASYQLLKNGVLLGTHISGATWSFTLTGNGTFAIQVWYTRQVTILVMLVFDMFGIGIVIGIIGAALVPLKDAKNRKSKFMVNHLFHMLIYIVIALALLGAVYAIFLGA